MNKPRAILLTILVKNEDFLNRADIKTLWAVACRGLNPDSGNQDDFYVERTNGFWWVTERGTKHNYAQTDSKERADEICRQLNAGVRDFDVDGSPADNDHNSTPRRAAPDAGLSETGSSEGDATARTSEREAFAAGYFYSAADIYRGSKTRDDIDAEFRKWRNARSSLIPIPDDSDQESP